MRESEERVGYGGKSSLQEIQPKKVDQPRVVCACHTAFPFRLMNEKSSLRCLPGGNSIEDRRSRVSLPDMSCRYRIAMMRATSLSVVDHAFVPLSQDHRIRFLCPVLKTLLG